MKREIKTTKDGSKTLYINDLNESYHSQHGAIQEAKHVFIKNGLNQVNKYEINILELGLGTGLNVLVTIDDIMKNNKNQVIHYFGIEKYPIAKSEMEALDYPKLFENEKLKKIYTQIHQTEWGKSIEIHPNFFLHKIKGDFYEMDTFNLPPIDLVYFDCFGARVQPDLWEKALFEKVNHKMANESLLTTYSAKGSVRRILQDLGFEVEKKQGPPGKREMINAWKK
ncbi:MAG: peptidase [Flavobacteriales bacterium]|nr:MAG: peptidase [Flavobacteriales bacterium]